MENKGALMSHIRRVFTAQLARTKEEEKRREGKRTAIVRHALAVTDTQWSGRKVTDWACVGDGTKAHTGARNRVVIWPSNLSLLPSPQLKDAASAAISPASSPSLALLPLSL